LIKKSNTLSQKMSLM